MAKQYIGTELVDKVEEVTGFLANLPGVKQTLQFVGGAAKLTNEYILDPLRYESEEALAGREANMGSALLGHVVRGTEAFINTAERGGATFAEKVGVDPRIGGFVGGGAAETLLTTGAGTVAKQTLRMVDTLTPPGGGQLALAGAGPQLSVSGGSVTLDPTVMKAVTATDPDILSVTGRRTGEDIVSSAQRKAFVKRTSEIQKYENTLVTLREELAQATASGANKRVLKDIRDKIGDAEEMLSRRQSNVLVPDSDDPLWYKTSKSKSAKKLEQVRRKMVGQYLEEHHIFPKGMSAAFFNRMDELIASGVAEADDLLLMAEYASKSGVKAGDVRSNLVNLMKDPHNELHQVLRAQGDEIGKQQWKRILSEVDTVDDLLAIWKDVIGRNVKPNAETARIWQPLDDLIQEIRSSP